QDLLARDRHPVLALFIDLPGAEVDVNVHPAKTEVRFRDPAGIRGLIVGGLRHALDEAGHRSAQRPSAAALGNWISDLDLLRHSRESGNPASSSFFPPRAPQSGGPAFAGVTGEGAETTLHDPRADFAPAARAEAAT